MESLLIHPASSSSWGAEAAARLCKIVLDHNTGAAQQIQENRSDLLDLLSVDQLKEQDDLGLSLSFLCVYYDRPDMLEYLHKRGINLSESCDPIKFGNPMFYALSMNRHQLVTKLHDLGYSVANPCDTFNTLPILHAYRIDDKILIDLITYLAGRELRAWILWRKHFLRKKYTKRYAYIRTTGIPLLQRAIRGFFGRLRANRKRQEVIMLRKQFERDERIRLGLAVDDNKDESDDNADNADDVDDENNDNMYNNNDN